VSGEGRPLLGGVRVLDLTHMMAGPYATRLLGDLGAEVIKVEPITGDPMRKMGPHFAGGESAYFLSISANKRSIALDLKKPEGRRLLLDLVTSADAVVENFRVGVLDSLGLGYDDLREANPSIVLCSLSGFGGTGPERDRPAFDLAIQAFSGAMSVTGGPEGPPARLGVPMGDLSGGLFLALSVTAALYRRATTGEGAHVDLALSDSLVSLLTYMGQFWLTAGEVSKPVGSGHRNVVPYRAYQTDDGWLVVAAFADRFWRNLCEAVERPDLVDDPRFGDMDARRDNREAMDAILEEIFRGESTDDWLRRLRDHEVPSSRVNRIDQALDHPQTRHREMVVVVDHPAAGRLEMLGNPVKVAGVEDRFAPPPLLGQDTDEILKASLGLSESEIARLRADGVIR